MKKFIALEINIPDNITDKDEIEFLTKLVEDLKLQPRAFTFGHAPSGNPIYFQSNLITGEWEYV